MLKKEAVLPVPPTYRGFYTKRTANTYKNRLILDNFRPIPYFKILRNRPGNYDILGLFLTSLIFFGKKEGKKW
jgi:hypothetical protein